MSLKKYNCLLASVIAMGLVSSANAAADHSQDEANAAVVSTAKAETVQLAEAGEKAQENKEAKPEAPSEEAVEATRKLWGDSLEKSLALSNETGKPILIFYYTTWCPFCKNAEKNYFPQPEATELMKSNYIMLKMDITDEKGENAKFYWNYFGERGVPSLLMINGKKEKLHTKVGLKSQQQLMDALNTGLKKDKALKDAAAAEAAKAKEAPEVKPAI